MDVKRHSNHTRDCQLNCDCDWRLTITFQPIRVKQSPIEISDCRLDNVLFYNRQLQSAECCDLL